jgi:phosphohistidine phosphatase
MELYLIQHGQAMTKEQNPDRPLSEEGRAAARRTAETAVKLGIEVTEIRHSDKLRAMQTAEEIGRALGATCHQSTGLAPKDDVQRVASELGSCREDVMIVGHLPFLSRLAAFLLCGNTNQAVVELQMAGIVRLDRRDNGTWCLVWNIPPEIMVVER